MARNRYKEEELLALIGEVVEKLNAQLQETKIHALLHGGDTVYQFRDRSLHVHFFAPGEIYANPEIPALIGELRKRHVVHGGYLEIRELGEDREGWNIVLVRSPESMYGEWRIVESEVSPLTRKAPQFKPIASEARLFATNLAYHWMRTTHSWQLKNKSLERADILRIFEVLIPKL